MEGVIRRGPFRVNNLCQKRFTQSATLEKRRVFANLTKCAVRAPARFRKISGSFFHGTDRPPGLACQHLPGTGTTASPEGRSHRFRAGRKVPFIYKVDLTGGAAPRLARLLENKAGTPMKLTAKASLPVLQIDGLPTNRHFSPTRLETVWMSMKKYLTVFMRLRGT